jgi:Glyoxalase-like domain
MSTSMPNTLFAVALDCGDPWRLGRFYQAFMGGELFASNNDFVVLRGAAIRLDFQRVENRRTPTWPDAGSPRRVHLDFIVHDLAGAASLLVELGAERPAFQQGGQKFLVLLDPAGHPF